MVDGGHRENGQSGEQARTTQRDDNELDGGSGAGSSSFNSSSSRRGKAARVPVALAFRFKRKLFAKVTVN